MEQHVYRLTHMMGDGTYGTVWLAEDSRGERFAVKRLKSLSQAGVPTSAPEEELVSRATLVGGGHHHPHHHGHQGHLSAPTLPHCAAREVQALRRVGGHANVVALKHVAIETEAPRRASAAGRGGRGGQQHQPPQQPPLSSSSSGEAAVLLVFEALDANLHQTIQAAAAMLAANASGGNGGGGNGGCGCGNGNGGGGSNRNRAPQPPQQPPPPPQPPLLPEHVVRGWAHQLLSGLAAVHRSGIMHRDVKPENVLVGLPAAHHVSSGNNNANNSANHLPPSPSSAAAAQGAPLSQGALQRRLRAHCASSGTSPPAVVKLADFGLARSAPECESGESGTGGGGGASAAFATLFGGVGVGSASTSSTSTTYDRPLTSYVSTRWYRAPEVLLRAPSYGRPVDMWAAGCVLAEIAAMRPLFPGATEHDTLLLIASGLGPPGACGWREGERLAAARGVRLPAAGPQTPPLVVEGGGGGGGSSGSVRGGWAPPAQAAAVARLLPAGVSPLAADLIACLCAWDPAARPTAEQALAHPYFAGMGGGGGSVPRSGLAAVLPPPPLPPPPGAGGGGGGGRGGGRWANKSGGGRGGSAGGRAAMPPPPPRQYQQQQQQQLQLQLPARVPLPPPLPPPPPPPAPVPAPALHHNPRALFAPYAGLFGPIIIHQAVPQPPQPPQPPPPQPPQQLYWTPASFFFSALGQHNLQQLPPAPPPPRPPRPPRPPQQQQQQQQQPQYAPQPDGGGDRLMDRLLRRRLH